MNIIFRVRGFICRMIKRVNVPILAVLKFGAYFMLFHYVAGLEGFQAGLKINSLMIQVILAVISTILPNRHGIFLAIVMLLANIWQVTQIGTAVAGILFLFVYIMTARLFPDQVYMLALVPLCLHYNLILLLPAFVGMYIGIIAIVPMISGVIISILMGLLPEFMALKMPEKIDAIPQMLANVFRYAFDKVLHNETLLYLMILFTVVVTLIYLLRKIEINFGGYIAVTAGIVLGVLTLIMAKMNFDITIPNQELYKQAGIALAIMLFIEFMHKALDYEATERLTFEDDEYEYHVTLIPKIYGGKKKKKKRKGEIETEEDLSPIEQIPENAQEPVEDQAQTTVVPDTSYEEAEYEPYEEKTRRFETVVDEESAGFRKASDLSDDLAEEELPEPEDQPINPIMESVFTSEEEPEEEEKPASTKEEVSLKAPSANELDNFFDEE